MSEMSAKLLDEGEAERNVQLHRSGKRRHATSSPVVQLQGPLLPIMLCDGQESLHHPLGVGHNYFG